MGLNVASERSGSIQHMRPHPPRPCLPSLSAIACIIEPCSCCDLWTRAARVVLLDVTIASHTPHLTGTVAAFREALKTTRMAGPQRDRMLLAGGNGARIFSAADAIAKLAAQVATPVDWAATLWALVECGVDRILDVDPGHAFADMMRAPFPAV